MESKSHYKFDFLSLVKIGQGTFSTVYSFICKNDNKKYIIKKMRREENGEVEVSTMYEFNSLKQINHINIINILKIVLKKNEIYFILPFFPKSLKAYIEDDLYGKLDIKKIMYQIVSAVNYIHALGFIHRDLKPQNIVISDKGLINIIDFNSCIYVGVSCAGFEESQTLSYRSPELLCEFTIYSYEVDIWSVGIIFGELIAKKTNLFDGDSEINQLYKYFRNLGTPNDDFWASTKGAINKDIFPKWKKDKEAIKKMLLCSDEEYDFFEKATIYNVHKRAKSIDLLNHSYFYEIRPYIQREDLSENFQNIKLSSEIKKNHYIYYSNVNLKSLYENETLPPKILFDNLEHISLKMFNILVDWMIETSNYFKFRNTTLILSFYLLNKVLSILSKTQKNFLREDFQLLGIVCIHISAEMIEIISPCISEYVYICNNIYTCDEIINFKGKVLEYLDYVITMPTSALFLHNICSIMEEKIHLECYTCIKILIYDVIMFKYKPSIIANSAIYLIKDEGSVIPNDMKECLDDMKLMIKTIIESDESKEFHFSSFKNDKKLNEIYQKSFQ